MQEPGSGQSTFGGWPGFALAMLLTVGAVWVQTPFRPDRPAESKVGLPSLGMQDIDARLWQDPFAAVAEAPQAEVAKPGAPDSPGDGARREGAHDFNWLFKQIRARRAVDRTPLRVLAVMVSGGPSIGAAELRRRYRYAALSGLMLEGFEPADPEHIGAVDLGLSAPPKNIPFEWFYRNADSGGARGVAKRASAAAVGRSGCPASVYRGGSGCL